MFRCNYKRFSIKYFVILAIYDTKTRIWVLLKAENEKYTKRFGIY